MNCDHLKYEDALMGILDCEGEIFSFLDVIFGFLYRRTDFYRIQRDENQKFGFPVGVANKLVLQIFNKYLKMANEDEKAYEKRRAEKVTPPDKNSKEVKNVETRVSELTQKDFQNLSESYNGAVRENYSWSQTLKDIDVKLKVPDTITSGKQVKTCISNSHLSVSIQEDDRWDILVDSKLKYMVNAEESMWTLMKGEHIFVNLEKADERWWDALLEGEPSIDVQKIDNSHPYEELDQDAQAKIDELMYNQQQKRLGKPTIEEQKVHSILKDAWDKEGSPFKGTPYDPNVVSVGNSDNLNFE